VSPVGTNKKLANFQTGMNYETTLIFLLATFGVATFIVSVAPAYYYKPSSYLSPPSPIPFTPFNLSSNKIVITPTQGQNQGHGRGKGEKKQVVNFSPPPAAPSKRHLALLCIERSGSTWLTAMLNNNPSVHLLAEPLIPLAGKYKHHPFPDIAAHNELNLLLSSLNQLEQETSPPQSSSSASSLIGFNEKFFYPKYLLPSNSSLLTSLSQYLTQHDYRIILLVRKNYVYQTISTMHAIMLAQKCGDAGWSKVKQDGWEKLCGEAHQEIKRKDISLESFQETLQDIRLKTRQVMQTAVQLRLPHLLVYYEDLMQSTPEVCLYPHTSFASPFLSVPQTIKTISEWIDYPLHITETIFVKQGASDLRETIPNYEELKTYLQQHEPCLVSHLLAFNPQEFCPS
jgi:hypothetical protein